MKSFQLDHKMYDSHFKCFHVRFQRILNIVIDIQSCEKKNRNFQEMDITDEYGRITE